jgi:Uma2 family endonuclease
MAIAERELKRPIVLTYEDYINEGETPGRYEIVDGVRECMTNPAAEHQLILRNINRVLEDFEESSASGIAFIAPLDIVVSKDPLQVREPDLLYISFDRWGDRDFTDTSPLTNSPELAVEILSPSETRRQIQKKVGQYAAAGVLECWLVSPEAETVELLKLSASGSERLGIYAPGQTLRSIAFPELVLDVARVFKLPRRQR